MTEDWKLPGTDGLSVDGSETVVSHTAPDAVIASDWRGRQPEPGRYGLERLLYRLSISEQAPNFLLEGASLFQLWYGQSHRPTRDADLLGLGPDSGPLSTSWSAAFDYGVLQDQFRARLASCHAFEDDSKSYRLVFPEQDSKSSATDYE